MIAQVVHYDFYGSQIRCDHPPVLEVNQYSNVEGFLEIVTPGITSGYTIEAEVYKLTPPSETESRYIRQTPDLYDPDVLTYSEELLSNGNLRVYYRVCPNIIPGIAYDDYIGVTFFINRNLSASSVKVATDIVVHINNEFKD